MRRRTLIVVTLAALLIGWAGTRALATIADPVIATNSADFDQDGAIDISGEGVFNNQDTTAHDVTADANGPDGKALFRTGNTPGQTMRQIQGTEYLAAGEYPFHCSLHSVMRGTFSVEDGRPAPPVQRPEISLKLKSKKLGKVVDSGKLKVKVESVGPTDAEGISLQGKKGKKPITKKTSLDLGAGDSETAKLKLKKKAAEKLADLKKAKVKVSGTVDFGFGDKASKKLK